MTCCRSDLQHTSANTANMTIATTTTTTTKTNITTFGSLFSGVTQDKVGEQSLPLLPAGFYRPNGRPDI